MDGPRVPERPSVHQQVWRVELRSVAVGDGDAGGGPLPRAAPREAHTAAGGRLQDDQATTLQPQHVSSTCLGGFQKFLLSKLVESPINF